MAGPGPVLPFDAMRSSLAPGGTAGVTNLVGNLDSPFFDSVRLNAATGQAEKRIAEVAAFGDMADPMSPLEAFAIALLIRASGRDHSPPALCVDRKGGRG
ncbi:hypothetical protein [Jannaschia formosa]|uniref:hypothetical protein n=1 Tax=Jannaschia formosa TaxID=2259592 RepID=UPI000E1BF94D|nr:hypothetical protein [Jannaschia formosa]TFL16027.1 hypothetical protein DR046_22130 [Jannaschia formosa]